jgi:tRNA(adenine34) deaminase
MKDFSTEKSFLCYHKFMKPNISTERVLAIIKLCQEEAEVAIQEGNVPISSIITDLDGNVLVTAHNTQNVDHDPTAHGEINALRMLGKQKSTRYLDDCVVFGNAEICSMCASACIKSHIYAFYYGAPAEASMDPWLPITDIAKVTKEPLYVEGLILGDECAEQIARGRAHLAEAQNK